MKQNKFGICEWSLPVVGPFGIKLAGEVGFDGIQLGDLGGRQSGFPLTHKRIQAGYLEAAAESGVELQSIHLHSLVRDGTMLYPDGSVEADMARESIDKGLQACKDMKVNTFMLSSFFATEIRNDYQFNNYAKILNYACDRADEIGVKVVFESILDIEHILRIREICGERLGYLMDILNPIRFGSGDPVKEILAFGTDYIDHVHVKDMPAEMVGCCALGEGSGRFNKSVEAIRSIGYTGWFVTENYYCQAPFNRFDPFESMKKDLDTMRRSFPND